MEWGDAGPRASLAGAARRTELEARRLHVIGDGDPLYVLYDMRQIELAWPTYDASAIEDDGDGSSIRAPIIGRVAKVFVTKGDGVAKGDRIAVVEAMKMEHVLHAARDGRIDKLAVKEGQQVTQGALIASLARSLSSRRRCSDDPGPRSQDDRAGVRGWLDPGAKRRDDSPTRQLARLDALDAGLLHALPGRRQRALRVDAAAGVLDHVGVEPELARVHGRPGDAEVGGEARPRTRS